MKEALKRSFVNNGIFWQNSDIKAMKNMGSNIINLGNKYVRKVNYL